MTSRLDTDRSQGDRARSRAYLIDFVPGIVGYGLVLAVVLTWGDLDGDRPARLVWALLPAVPALWIVRAVVRHLRRVDEYERLRLMQDLSVGFVVAMLASVTIGLLGVTGLALTYAGWLVYGAGMTAWLASSLLARRR